MSTINVGVIGYSEGNGHPYSFSAIINGYETDKMQKSPYPGIANYLDARNDEEFGIGDLKVTHAWAQDTEIAKNIADCTHIENISNGYKEMSEKVDAVLILRDDPESHRKIASHFLEAGKWVFLDKPLCDNLQDLNYFIPWIRKGKLMSCSGFRYYPGIVDRLDGRLNPEDIVFSNNISIINWYRYGIHVLEGITPIMGADVEWVQDIGEMENHIVRVQYKNGKYALIQVNNDLGFILSSSFYTKSGKHQTIHYDDNFSCFRGALVAFNEQITTGEPAIDPKETEIIIKTLISGERSLQNGGIKIRLDELS